MTIGSIQTVRTNQSLLHIYIAYLMSYHTLNATHVYPMSIWAVRVAKLICLSITHGSGYELRQCAGYALQTVFVIKELAKVKNTSFTLGFLEKRNLLQNIQTASCFDRWEEIFHPLGQYILFSGFICTFNSKRRLPCFSNIFRLK